MFLHLNQIIKTNAFHCTALSTVVDFVVPPFCNFEFPSFRRNAALVMLPKIPRNA